jgi:hypothetical protein
MDNKEIVGYIPKILYKIYLYLKDKFDIKKKVMEEETMCYEICKKLISLNESKLTIAPLSNKRYIKNDEYKMFIVIENRMMTLINYIYSYNVYFENAEFSDNTDTDVDNADAIKNTNVCDVTEVSNIHLFKTTHIISTTQ